MLPHFDFNLFLQENSLRDSSPKGVNSDGA